MKPSLYLGGAAQVDGRRSAEPRYLLPAHHLVTHGVLLGMTGTAT